MSDTDQKSRRETLARMIGALGVVYGDIGTSVLYAMQESFFGPHRLLTGEREVFGILSFFFWTLVLVVGVKYVGLVMRADNHGEGGIFALLALVSSARKRVGEIRLGLAFVLIILGAALLLAEGMITPAISVLSAVSGLELLAPGLASYVVPITLVVLVCLFLVQPFGTHKIGVVFGPIMLLWFLAISAISLPYLFTNPEIFKAINPIWAFEFVQEHGFYTVLILGSVVLCITGTEALYADMGHFGRRPITFSWWMVVLPALVLNYFGQGAALLSFKGAPVEHLFYALAPSWAMIPLILLATMATIIASQALISGAFSLIQQAIALGVFPRQKIIHTNPSIRGQIYLPFVNWTLMVGCLSLVVIFKSSSALAAAYGMAVTGTMTITTIGFYIVCRHIWNWRRSIALPICGTFLCIDLVFFGSNIFKFTSGGYVPIIIALLIFSMMHTWHWGRKFIATQYGKLKYYSLEELIDLKQEPSTIMLNRSLVVLASRPLTDKAATIPPALQSRLEHLGAIYRHIAILSVYQNPARKELPDSERYQISCFENNEWGTVTTIMIEYGFMEDPDLSKIIPELARQGVIKTVGNDKKTFTILSGSERIIAEPTRRINRLRLAFFRFLLRNANSVMKHFHLDNFADVSIEVVTLGSK